MAPVLKLEETGELAPAGQEVTFVFNVIPCSAGQEVTLASARSSLLQIRMRLFRLVCCRISIFELMLKMCLGCCSAYGGSELQ